MYYKQVYVDMVPDIRWSRLIRKMLGVNPQAGPLNGCHLTAWHSKKTVDAQISLIMSLWIVQVAKPLGRKGAAWNVERNSLIDLQDLIHTSDVPSNICLPNTPGSTHNLAIDWRLLVVDCKNLWRKFCRVSGHETMTEAPKAIQVRLLWRNWWREDQWNEEKEKWTIDCLLPWGWGGIQLIWHPRGWRRGRSRRFLEISPAHLTILSP